MKNNMQIKIVLRGNGAQMLASLSRMVNFIQARFAERRVGTACDGNLCWLLDEAKKALRAKPRRCDMAEVAGEAVSAYLAERTAKGEPLTNDEQYAVAYFAQWLYGKEADNAKDSK